MAFTMQAARDLFMSSFVIWGEVGKTRLLFSLFECHRVNRELQLPGPKYRPVIPKTVKCSDLFGALSWIVVVSLSGAGGTGFLVEEEADFGKFPDSHLSFLFGMGRRNEIRQRLMGHTFTRVLTWACERPM